MTPDCMDPDALPAIGEVRPRVMGVVLSLAACLIISTNLLVAAALMRLLLLKRRSQSWCFVLNLALADALVGMAITGLATEDMNSSAAVVVPPTTNATTPADAQGKSRCLMRMAFVTSPCTASIMSMFLISLDRYAAIKTPLRYSLLSGRGTAAASVLTLWIGSITVGFLPVMVRQLQSEGYDGFCAFFSVIHEVGIIVLFSVFFFPVLCVFVYIYLDILKIARGHQLQICRVREAGSRTAEDHHHHHLHPLPPPHHQQPQQLRSGYWSHVKALRTVAVLVGCFLVLWCPFFVVSVVHVLCRSCELAHVLENYLWLLGLCNSLINPLVYACWQREVRLQLSSMFSCFTGRPAAAAAGGAVTGRYQPQAPVRDGVGGGDGGETINPGLLIRCNEKTLSATTSL